MRKHGFRSIFSLLVALVMVCSLLPTAAFAEGNLEPTDQVTGQPTDQPEGGEVQQPTEKKEDAPQGEQPASPPQTYTVVYADGAENTVFEAKNIPNLTSGASTPAFGDNPVRDGYTFLGWEPALAETVTEDVTYTAKWEAVQVEPLPTETQPTEPQPPETQPTETQNSEQTGTVASTQNAEPNNARIALMAPRPQSTYIVLKATDVNPTGARVKRDTSLGGGTIESIADSGRPQARTFAIKVKMEGGGTFRFPQPNEIWQGVQSGTNIAIRLNGKTYRPGDTVSYDALTQGKENDALYSGLLAGDLTADADENIPNSGVHKMSFYITYHINDPSGTGERQYTVQYHVSVNNAGANGYKMSSDKFRSYGGCNFSLTGYEPSETDKTWYTSKDCTTLQGGIHAYNNSHFHFYAHWKQSAPTTYDYSFTLNYDGNANDTTLANVPVTQTCTETSTEASLSYTFTIPSTEPTREGYTFQGWSNTAGGEVDYAAGGSYTMNATKDSPNPAAILYAVWEEITYTVTYTDGVDGEEIFDDVVYHNLKAGDSTPTFNGTPIRKGYTFAGWNPEVAPTVTGDRIYTATWEPALPGAIFGSFIMKCVTTPKPSHYLIERADIELAPLNAYTNSGVQKGESGDTPTYYFELTVDAEKYLSQYDTKAAPTVGDPIAHTICDGQQTHPVIRYDWNGTAWVQVNKPVVEVKCTPAPVTFTVTYTDGVENEEVFQDQSYTVESGKPTPAFSDTPTRSGYTFAGWQPAVAETVTGNALYTAQWTKNAPAKPEGDELPDISVTVDCTNTSVTHPDKTYGLLNGCYTVTEPTPGENGAYGCAIEIDGQKYVEHYSGETDIGCAHSLVTVDTRSPYVYAYLKAVETDTGYQWSIDEEKGSSASVTFKAVCEIVPPARTFTVTYTDGVDDVEVFADQITKNLKLGSATPSFSGTPTREGYTFDGWEPEVASTVTGNATYVAQWTKNAPAKPTENDLAGIKVFVQCTNSGATHGDKRKEYGLIGTDGYYYVGNPTFLESDGKYYCTVNVNGERYVAKYSTDTGVQHTYMSVDTVYKYAYLTATWTDGGYVWSVDKDGSTVTFEAWCETVPPAQTFTVTYKDGVAGKAFQDQSYTVPSGSATPAFNGTPYLAGYVFTDWTPAVATTVTANATYIATWKLDTNNNGKPDDEEERYTVTYTDGAGGKAFADQVYTGLLSGTSTPKFDGTPVRSGYVFIGWSPVWSGTVTGNVTYTATWSTITGGLDKVPKTGDNGLTLALSALLLFSLCGAAACVISTRKRG